jgi:hypothetical protein
MVGIKFKTNTQFILGKTMQLMEHTVGISTAPP